MYVGGPRFDYEPLRLFCGWRTIGEAVTRLHVPRRDVEAYVEHGLTVRAADKIAVKLEVHPSQIWETWDADLINAVSADDFDGADLALVRFALVRLSGDNSLASATRRHAMDLVQRLNGEAMEIEGASLS